MAMRDDEVHAGECLRERAFGSEQARRLEDPAAAQALEVVAIAGTGGSASCR